MAKYLIDVNLPYYFNLWNNADYIHQIDVEPKMKDKDIWSYAKEHELVIVTKDSDFSNRIMFKEPPPKVIHIKIGNVGMNEFHQIITSCWEKAQNMIQDYKLVNVYQDRVEGIQ